MALTTNENHDKIWAIIRDAMNNAISINDAVAKIKGLQDGTELTEENYEMADNVNPDKAEDQSEQEKVQQKAIENEQAFAGNADPGKDADADINDIVGVDETDDTTTLGVVPDDQTDKYELKGNLVTAKPEATEDGKAAKPASESNEVAPAVGDTADEEEKPQLSKRQQKKQAALERAEEESKENGNS